MGTIEDYGLDIPAPALRRHRIRQTLPTDGYDPALDRIGADLEALPDPGLLTAAQVASTQAKLQQLTNMADAYRDHLAAAADDAGYGGELHAGTTGTLIAAATTANPAAGTASVHRGLELRQLKMGGRRLHRRADQPCPCGPVP